jgi:hypothetical protein
MKLNGRSFSKWVSSSSPYSVPIASVTWWLGSDMESWLVCPRRLAKLVPIFAGGLFDAIMKAGYEATREAERAAVKSLFASPAES